MLTGKVREFKPHKLGLRKVLGDLEAEIMEVVWQHDRVLVRDVHRELVKRRAIAYTTVMTVMGRLAEKKILSREQQGNAYVYTPRFSQKEFTGFVAKEVIDGLLEDFAEPAIFHFVSRISQTEDDEQLQRLEELIEGLRKEEVE